MIEARQKETIEKTRNMNLKTQNELLKFLYGIKLSTIHIGFFFVLRGSLRLMNGF